MAKKKIQELVIYDVEELWLMREILIDWKYELKHRGVSSDSKRCKRVHSWFKHFNR